MYPGQKDAETHPRNMIDTLTQKIMYRKDIPTAAAQISYMVLVSSICGGPGDESVKAQLLGARNGTLASRVGLERCGLYIHVDCPI